MISVKVDFKDFTKYIEKISNKRNLFQGISDYLVSGDSGTPYDNIDYYGSLFGGDWVDLSLFTKNYKQFSYGRIYPILKATGRLQNSLKGGSDNINIISDDYLEFGTKVEYAYKHEFGTEKIPKRSFLDTENQVFITRIEKIMQDFISEN